MAAGPAIEAWSKQTGTAESPDGKQRIITMQRGFTVTLDPTDRIEVAYQADGLPLVNNVYPGTLFVICRKLSLTRLAPALVMVIADYSGEIGPGGVTSSPIDNEVIVTWRNATTDEAIDEDWNGKPIVTKNGEAIDGISERISDQIATVERNFLTVNMYAIRAYLRAVNTDEFLGWPAGTARLMDYNATNVITNGVAGFWKVSATIQFREPYRTTPERAWWKRVRHEGYLVRDSAGEDPHIAWDLKTKSPVTKPILLKEDGTREENPDNAHWLEFETLGKLPYSALGLL
jgi:hypothetical protein